MTPILQIQNLTKTFSQPGGSEPLTILDIPEFEMAEGEQTALIGQSGGGKTTLLHLIAGLLLPTTGTIRIDNIEFTKLSEQGRDRFRATKIGYVFQTFNLLPAFTAIENVRLGMTFGHGRIDSRRASELLSRVGLADRAHYRPGQLSVGQQQRVAIARALAGKPRVLLADEPTANVDPASAESVLELIRTTCKDESIALVLVTHSMDVANKFDRVVQLETINRALKPLTPAA
jgi:ABC-type lipoprotein export system ATPase subunit